MTTIPTEADLRAAVAPLVGLTDPADLAPDANLVVLGLSSLALMRLVGHWNKAKIPAVFEELVAAPTLTGWLAHFATLHPTGTDGTR